MESLGDDVLKRRGLHCGIWCLHLAVCAFCRAIPPGLNRQIDQTRAGSLPPVVICVAVFAQRGGESRGGGGRHDGGHAASGGEHIPAGGPASAQAAKPVRASTPARAEQAAAENRPKVDKSGHQAFLRYAPGRTSGPDRVAAPPMPITALRSRGHTGISAAVLDRNIVAGWNWSGDRIAIYEDPGHVGWYLAHNPRLGAYARVEYLGG